MKKPKLSSSHHHQGWVILWKDTEQLFDNGFYETFAEAKNAIPTDGIINKNLHIHISGLIVRKAQLAFY